MNAVIIILYEVWKLHGSVKHRFGADSSGSMAGTQGHDKSHADNELNVFTGHKDRDRSKYEGNIYNALFGPGPTLFLLDQTIRVRTPWICRSAVVAS